MRVLTSVLVGGLLLVSAACSNRGGAPVPDSPPSPGPTRAEEKPAPTSLEQTRALLVGKWLRDGDPNRFREFHKDGTVHDGSTAAVFSGRYAVVKADGLDLELGNKRQVTIVKLTPDQLVLREPGGTEEKYQRAR